MSIAEFAVAARNYCARTSGSVTSWGRTIKHNRAVGGVAGGPHEYWVGADVVYDDQATYLDEGRKNVAGAYGLEIIFEQTPLHDHLQPIGWENELLPGEVR